MARLSGTVQETTMLGTGNHGRQENLLPLTPSVEEGQEERLLGVLHATQTGQSALCLWRFPGS